MDYKLNTYLIILIENWKSKLYKLEASPNLTLGYYVIPEFCNLLMSV